MSVDYYSTKYIIKRLLVNHVKVYQGKIWLAVFSMMIGATCTAAIIKLVQPAIDQMLISNDRTLLAVYPLLMIGIYVIKGIAEYFQIYLIKYIGQKILTDLQMAMYQQLLYADLSVLQSFSSGRLISRFTNDVVLMRGAVSNLLVGCARHFLVVIFLIVVMFKLEPVLSSLVFVAFPLATYPVQKLGHNIRKILSTSQEELSNYTATLDETFQSIKIVKSFCAEQVEITRARKVINKLLNFYKRTAKLEALVAPITEILSGLAIGGVVWYEGLLIFEGKSTPGALFAFITAFVTAYRPFKSLISLNIHLQEGLAAAKRVFHILDITPTIKSGHDACTHDFINTEVNFDDVELKFGKKVALKSITLTLKQHKTTALVGRSGSGKTSLANLLVRFYDPSGGKITIDGRDIRKYNLNFLRNHIGYVTQDTLLFDTTVAENIAYGNKKASMEAIIKAAQLASADEFISHLPEQYNTIVGSQGATLSGGQRQRIAIARAFLKDAPILILDEATSALDLNAEQAILLSLKKLRAGKTTLIITHRLASIVDAEEIVVIKAGKILEQGIHKELMTLKGEYYKLYNKELEEKR